MPGSERLQVVLMDLDTPWMESTKGKHDSWTCLMGGSEGIILVRGNGRVK